MNQTKTAADYAAIAVAPLLIFLMISSLANFLTLTLYRGGFPGRVSWVLMMFTLGAVGIARVAIERDRAYSIGYAGILGLVTFVAMLRFVDSPVFIILILGLIAYLSDIIVRDCTLIDETVDASGEGLIDTGRLFVKKRIEANPDAAKDPDGEPAGIRRNKPHQPGRTVLYLALAALPLFGLGQFFLRNDADTWSRAQRLLAFYLFASLSLLVTTSLLGLRRYLRQRKVEMPVDVSIAWLLGGLVMIATVLLLAYMAPMPGQALATFELPVQLDSPGNTQASRFGWGDEGADQDNPNAPRTIDPSEGKEERGQSYQKGAPEGDVGEGSRQQGPTGKQSGGKQGASPSKQSSQGQSSKGQSSRDQESSKSQSSKSQSSKSQSSKDQESSKGQASKRGSSENESRDARPSQDASGSEQESSPDQANPTESQSSQESDQGNKPESNESQDSRESTDPANKREPQSQRSESQRSESQSRESSAPSPSNAPSPLNPVGMINGLIKLLVFLALAGVIAAFLWINRELIRQWWETWLARRMTPEEEVTDEFLSAITQVPPREFASFRNPIGKESDVRRIVVITFQAFEAWAREHGVARNRDETPTEFLRRAAQLTPQTAAPAGQVVDAYNRVVYGRGKPTPKDLQAAEQVWRLMQASM